MHPRVLLSAIRIIRNNALAISISIEVDTPRGNDADEVWAEALEEGAPAFNFVYGKENAESFSEMEEC
jgi:hypothetical protein